MFDVWIIFCPYIVIPSSYPHKLIKDMVPLKCSTKSWIELKKVTKKSPESNSECLMIIYLELLLGDWCPDKV